ncbi:DUF4229 domain-containing protein, partial [Dysosmobacter welbionis]
SLFWSCCRRTLADSRNWRGAFARRAVRSASCWAVRSRYRAGGSGMVPKLIDWRRPSKASCTPDRNDARSFSGSISACSSSCLPSSP